MSIYKDCDIRGIYGRDFDEKDAYLIGRAVGTILTGKSVLVCGDVRVSTDLLKENLIKGLLNSGADVTDIGVEPTPVFYYSIRTLKTEGGIMVTASHNPPEYNGFKVVLGKMPITVDDIRRIEQLVVNEEFIEGKGSIEHRNMEENYIDDVKSLVKRGNNKVVIDAGNGCTSKIGPRIFTELGYDVERLFCEFDGSFPNRNPNPAVYENLKKLQYKVVEVNADIGVAFDGDGDRVVFVDETGKIVTSEQSLCIMIKHIVKEKEASIVYDHKASAIIKKVAEAQGIHAFMEKSGHAFIKATFLKNKSALAGEISGHYFFKELGYDDGIYAALKMLELLNNADIGLSKIVKQIPTTIITPDIRVFWRYEEQDALLKKVESIKKQNWNQDQNQINISYLDGVRVEFSYGWLLVRKSVTEEGITIRIEADDEQHMQKIIQLLIETAPELKNRHVFK